MSSLAFPTPTHERTAESIVAFAKSQPVEAVVLVNSCARGVAVPASDLDVDLLVAPELPLPEREAIESAWRCYRTENDVFREFGAIGRFSYVHLDVVDGVFEPAVWDEGGGPDDFEIGIGNLVERGVALFERSDVLATLRSRWLPYYRDALRTQRLAMVRDACALDLERVVAYAERGEPFYAFNRLYQAFQEFLQALFISRRRYPITYWKWIEEQVSEWLGLPELYGELTSVLSVDDMSAAALTGNASRLRDLVDRWTR